VVKLWDEVSKKASEANATKSLEFAQLSRGNALAARLRSSEAFYHINQRAFRKLSRSLLAETE
jgi:hypothetical protein